MYFQLYSVIFTMILSDILHFRFIYILFINVVIETIRMSYSDSDNDDVEKDSEIDFVNDD